MKFLFNPNDKKFKILCPFLTFGRFIIKLELPNYDKITIFVIVRSYHESVKQNMRYFL